MAHTLGTQERTQSELTNIFLTPNRNQYIYAQLVSTINTKTGLQLLTYSVSGSPQQPQ